MATVAGYQALVYTSLNGSSWNQVTLSSDVKPGGIKSDMLDRTYYGQGDAQKRRSKGLHDNSVTLKLDYDSADSRVSEIISAGDAGTALWLKVLYDGTHGFSQTGLISGYDISPPINGKPELTATWVPNGTKTSI